MDLGGHDSDQDTANAASVAMKHVVHLGETAWVLAGDRARAGATAVQLEKSLRGTALTPS